MLAASFGNYSLNLIEGQTSKNLTSFADFSSSFLIYVTILSANRSIFAEGIRSNNFLGFRSKPFMNCLFENSLVLMPISAILIAFGNSQIKILGIFLIPLVLHDNIRYMYINENRIKLLLVIDFAWTVIFFLIFIFLYFTKELTSLNVFLSWVFPTLLTVIFFGSKFTVNIEKSNFLKFPWMRANMINIKYSIFDYIFGSGLAQILILLAVLNGQSTNSSSLRICQLLLFPLVILHTVENLEKSDKAKLKTPPKILLQRDFNLKSMFLLSLVLGAVLLSISAPFINVFVPDNNGFNYTLLYSYTFFIILNSILIPYFNIFKNTNNYRIIQEARKYYLFSLGFFLILGQELPELDRLVLLLGLSTIPMIFKFEIGRRRLHE